MKLIFIIIAICSSLLSIAQEENHEKKWDAPYYLSTPAGWGVEQFPMPVSFAPAITYSGMEDIRFMPGWGKANSSEYWTYAFLWFIDGKQHFDIKKLQTLLIDYYTGLFKVNTGITDSIKYPRALVTIRKTKKDPADNKTFDGIVRMNNYMNKEQITLNLRAHVKYCEGQKKTFVFFELSPQPYAHEVWRSLTELWKTFRCIK